MKNRVALNIIDGHDSRLSTRARARGKKKKTIRECIELLERRRNRTRKTARVRRVKKMFRRK